MESFALLKKGASWNSKLESFSELPIGEYAVTDFSLVQTEYGPRIKVVLGDKFVFLPNRFSKNLTAEQVQELNSIPQILIFSGIDTSRRKPL